MKWQASINARQAIEMAYWSAMEDAKQAQEDRKHDKALLDLGRANGLQWALRIIEEEERSSER